MTEPIPGPVIYSLRPEVRWREEHFGFLLHDGRTDTLFEGNHTGRSVLDGLASGASPDEICDRIGAECDVGESRVRADIAAFLGFLEDEGLLERRP